MLNKRAGCQIKINKIWFKIKDKNSKKNNKICKNSRHQKINFLKLRK